VFREFDKRLADGLEGAKWLAIILMACSHTGMAMGGDWLWPGFWIGRVCAPIFCFVIVARLSEKPLERSTRYLIKLSAWGVLAQIPYSAWTWNIGFHFNVLITLGGGVVLIWMWVRDLKLLSICMAMASLYIAAIYDLGWIDPSFILAGYLLHKRSPSAAALCISVLFAAAMLYSRPHDWIAPAICMLVPPIIFLSASFSARLVRLPGWTFYAFYPAHIGLIFLVSGPLPSFSH
jgi:hypothetical protein